MHLSLKKLWLKTMSTYLNADGARTGLLVRALSCWRRMVRVCVCVCARARVCVCVCIYLYTCVYIYICIYIYILCIYNTPHTVTATYRDWQNYRNCLPFSSYSQPVSSAIVLTNFNGFEQLLKQVITGMRFKRLRFVVPTCIRVTAFSCRIGVLRSGRGFELCLAQGNKRG
jgi:hypothetical protein